MRTQEEAQAEAVRLVESYINESKPENTEDVAKLIVKLLSVTTALLASVHGPDFAVVTLQSVMVHIHENPGLAKVQIVSNAPSNTH